MTTSTAERPVKGKHRVAVSDLKDEFLDCRDLRHSWGRASDWNVTRGARGTVIEFTRVVTCRRCRTERHETYSVPTMDLVKRRYVYPEKFLLVGSHGDNRVDVRDIRREVFKRVYAG